MGCAILRGNFQVTNQPDLEALVAADAECLIIIGSLRLSGDGIVDLRPLSKLVEIDRSQAQDTSSNGALSIENAKDLRSLRGLERLAKLEGDLSLFALRALDDLSALQSLRELQGNLSLRVLGHIPDLKPFQGLRRVGKSDAEIGLWLDEILGIRSLDLDALQEVQGSISISGNDALEHVAFPRLSRVSGALIIGEGLNGARGNAALRDVDVPALTTAEDARVVGNAAVTDVRFPKLEACSSAILARNQALLHSDLHSLRSVSTLEFASNPALERIEPMQSLTAVRANVNLSGMDALVEFSGLSNLTEVPGNFLVEENARLESLEGFPNLRSVGTLRIRRNPSLRPSLAEDFRLRFRHAPSAERTRDEIVNNGRCALGQAYPGSVLIERTPDLSWIQDCAVIEGDLMLRIDRAGRLDVPEVLALHGSLRIGPTYNVQEIHLSGLSRVDGSLFIDTNLALRTLDVAGLRQVGGDLNFNVNPKLSACLPGQLARALRSFGGHILSAGLAPDPACP